MSVSEEIYGVFGQQGNLGFGKKSKRGKSNEPNVLSLTCDVTTMYSNLQYMRIKNKDYYTKKYLIHLISALIRNCPSSRNTYMNKAG